MGSATVGARPGCSSTRRHLIGCFCVAGDCAAFGATCMYGEGISPTLFSSTAMRLIPSGAYGAISFPLDIPGQARRGPARISTSGCSRPLEFDPGVRIEAAHSASRLLESDVDNPG